ncbi:hypothetical protein M4I32_09965 [Microbacterium sp. LRZ72]|uniref:hypothetical protein n=1 Tax=Microbacterium sp. LRZ72 TaxID=2942481 RepID=UPI0029B48BAE|nr:hypothetical protein [Microbacterium sp. LRZ72]MDX2377124.1 hypothetical protein [Microbacterium sp. LRZ72]
MTAPFTTAPRPNAAGTTTRHPDDAGATLVELILYGMLSALFLGILAVLFATGLSAGAAATERDQATGRAQVVANSVQTSIRNASEFRVDGGMLRARVADGASGWRCEAWVLHADGTLLHRTSASAIPLDSVPGAGWSEMATGVTGTGPDAAPFTGSGRSLTISLTVTTGDVTVPLAGGAFAQAAHEGTGSACW